MPWVPMGEGHGKPPRAHAERESLVPFGANHAQSSLAPCDALLLWSPCCLAAVVPSPR